MNNPLYSNGYLCITSLTRKFRLVGSSHITPPPRGDGRSEVEASEKMNVATRGCGCGGVAGGAMAPHGAAMPQNSGLHHGIYG
jgi:hypothetical protein